MDDTLVTRLRAHLDEVEQHARKDLSFLDRASNGGDWEYGLGYNLPYSELGLDGSIGRLTASYGRPLADGEPDQHNADALLVARMVRSARARAERMLRLVERDRALLDIYEEAGQYYDANRSAPAGEMTGLRNAINLAASFWLGEDSTDG